MFIIKIELYGHSFIENANAKVVIWGYDCVYVILT